MAGTATCATHAVTNGQAYTTCEACTTAGTYRLTVCDTLCAWASDRYENETSARCAHVQGLAGASRSSGVGGSPTSESAARHCISCPLAHHARLIFFQIAKYTITRSAVLRRVCPTASTGEACAAPAGFDPQGYAMFCLCHGACTASSPVYTRHDAVYAIALRFFVARLGP